VLVTSRLEDRCDEQWTVFQSLLGALACSVVFQCHLPIPFVFFTMAMALPLIPVGITLAEMLIAALGLAAATVTAAVLLEKAKDLPCE
jgi:hypothetical protein